MQQLPTTVSYNQETYREFCSCEEAQVWAELFYSDILSLPKESKQYHEISTYTGSWYKATNKILRIMPPYGTPEYYRIDPNGHEETLESIETIAEVLMAHKLPENIIAYRYCHLSAMRKLCKTLFLHRGIVFSDNAFLSTGIVKEQLERFRRGNRCSCMLKLYLPKGTHGAYVTFTEDRELLNEQEFLLPSNVRFRILKIHQFTFPVMIECVALVD